MKRHFVCFSLLVALAFAPQLFADDQGTEVLGAMPTAQGPTVEAAVTSEPSVDQIGQSELTPMSTELTDLGLPKALVFNAASLNPTCEPCATHADCESVCGGGQLYFDYICLRTWEGCDGERYLQCSCS